MSDYDRVERQERIDVGFSISVKSKRGTGTRDQDEVQLTLEQEERPTTDQIENLTRHVERVMNLRREHQPDGEDDE